jgi:predicted ThiF/HesA family dinucleotide-utilizing enzyme
MKQKRTFTIEIDRVKITTTRNHRHLAWCGICRAESEFLDRMEAAHLAKIIRAQGVAVDEDNLHFYRPAGEQALICLTSLLGRNDPKYH